MARHFVLRMTDVCSSAALAVRSQVRAKMVSITSVS
jgi:hypothetical protein